MLDYQEKKKRKFKPNGELCYNYVFYLIFNKFLSKNTSFGNRLLPLIIVMNTQFTFFKRVFRYADSLDIVIDYADKFKKTGDV